MINRILFVLACLGHFSAEARLLQGSEDRQQEMIRQHLMSGATKTIATEAIKCTFGPDDITRMGLGADDQDDNAARVSQVESAAFYDVLYENRESPESCASTTLVPDVTVGEQQTYILYICTGNAFLGVLSIDCSFLTGEGDCPYTNTGPDVDWDWVSSLYFSNFLCIQHLYLIIILSDFL